MKNETLNTVQSSDNILFGIRPAMEAIKAGKEIEKIYIQKGLKSPLSKELIFQLRQSNIPFQVVPIEKLNKITRKKHQGVITLLSSITYASLDHIIDQCYLKGKDPFILILDRITDVRNFGAIARTAECLGVDAIVIPQKGSAQIGGDAVKTSAGALNHIPVCRVNYIIKTIEELKATGIYVIACTEKADKYIYNVNLNQPIALILGSEKDGISPAYIKAAHACIKIPILGKVQSLNVSVAAAMFMYETTRQRKINKLNST